jgi:hypothetical protein
MVYPSAVFDTKPPADLSKTRVTRLRSPTGMASLFFAVLAFCFITATAPFMLARRQKYSMNRRLCAAGSAF